ncbi:MAG: RDD family protein [Chitinophagaceae bacterium]
MEPILTESQDSSPRYPLLTDRVQSTFIDTILIVVLMFAFSWLLEQFSEPPQWTRVAAFFLLFGIYEPICVTYGCTLGNYFKGIRVRQNDNRERRISFIRAFIRYILKLLLGWVSFLSVHLNSDRRAVHDFAAGSVMIFARS